MGCDPPVPGGLFIAVHRGRAVTCPGVKRIGIRVEGWTGWPLRPLPALSLRFCVGKRAEPTETAVLPPSSSVHPPLRARRASHSLQASRLSHGTCRPPAWPPTILPSKLPSPTLRVPASLPVTRSKPPSTVGSASCHAGHKEPCALEAPFTCRSKRMVPTRALGLPPWVKPPPWPPLGLPANLPIPRRIPPTPKEQAANPAWCNWLHDPLTPSLLCPSGSTSFPFLIPLGSPSVTPFTGE